MTKHRTLHQPIKQAGEKNKALNITTDPNNNVNAPAPLTNSGIGNRGTVPKPAEVTQQKSEESIVNSEKIITNVSNAEFINTFTVIKQNGNKAVMPGARSTTVEKMGCGPLSLYNILLSENIVPRSDASLNKVFIAISPYWNCKNGDDKCGSGVDSVVAAAKKFGLQPGEKYTDTTGLSNFTGVMSYGGKVSGEGANIPHLAALKCTSGDCCMMDSAYGGSSCNKCAVKDSNNLECGGYNYHIGATGGNPDILQEIIVQ